MDIYLGFDPGGKGNFGWAVCGAKANILHVRDKGTVWHPDEAIDAVKTVLSKIPNTEEINIIGAGIDAPLFWIVNGKRTVDKLIRGAINGLVKSPGGTVQEINSLRGACVVQGVLLAKLLYEEYSGISITESHPKALFCLLKKANKQKMPGSVSLKDKVMAKYLCYNENDEKCNDHEQDAILGAVTAFAQDRKLPGWKNILEYEEKAVKPFNYQAEYWMPWNRVEKSSLAGK